MVARAIVGTPGEVELDFVSSGDRKLTDVRRERSARVVRNHETARDLNVFARCIGESNVEGGGRSALAHAILGRVVVGGELVYSIEKIGETNRNDTRAVEQRAVGEKVALRGEGSRGRGVVARMRIPGHRHPDRPTRAREFVVGEGLGDLLATRGRQTEPLPSRLQGLHAVPIGAAEVDHERLSMGQKRNKDAAESSELEKKAADRRSAHGAMLPLLRIRCQLGMEFSGQFPRIFRHGTQLKPKG